MPISGRSRYEQFSFCPTFSLPLIYRELERAPPAEWRVYQAAPLSMTLTNRDLHGEGFGFNVSCPGVENLHSGSPTTS